MITKNIVNQSKSLVEVTVSVPWSDLEPLWIQTLTHLGMDLELPGFRKGTAPANMVEQNLGLKLQDEVLKAAMPQFLIEALKGSTVVPIDYPKYALVNFSKGANLDYKATVTNRPEVKVGDYKTIKIGRPEVKVVGDMDIDKVIDDLYKRWKVRQPGMAPVSTAEPTSPPAGSVGSISFQSGTPVATPITNGVVDVPDENFARAMGALSLLDLRTKVKTDLEGSAKYNNELDFEEAILQEVEKLTSVELPEILVEDELQRMLVSLQRRVADMGLLLDDYLRNQNKTLDQLKTEWRVQAEKNVRMELGLAEIARGENVVIADSDLQAEIDKIQDARVKKQFEAEQPRLQLRHALRQTKTLDLLKKMVGS